MWERVNHPCHLGTPYPYTCTARMHSPRRTAERVRWHGNRRVAPLGTLQAQCPCQVPRKQKISSDGLPLWEGSCSPRPHQCCTDSVSRGTRQQPDDSGRQGTQAREQDSNTALTAGPPTLQPYTHTYMLRARMLASLPLQLPPCPCIKGSWRQNLILHLVLIQC